MINDISRQAKTGIFWTALFNIIQYVVRFGSSIILARLLFPEDFGVMGLAMITVQFARRLASFGFSMAIVQRKDVDDYHFHTAFWFNLFLFSLVTVIIFFSSPFIAAFFSNETLELVLKVIAFSFMFQSFISVPRAILMRNMDFKKVGVIEFTGNAVNMLSSIGFALAGYGVWSLVFGVLLGNLVESVSGSVFTKWWPRLRFKMWALKDIFSFGMWVNILTYLNYFIKNVDYFFIGKFLGAAHLGYYERAFNLMNLPRKRIQNTINSVLFSTYSQLQHDSERILKAFLRVTTYISILSYPLMIGLFFAAPALITVLYGPKWIATIYPFQTMCISGLIYTFELAFDPLIMGKGLMSLQALRKFIFLFVLTSCVIIGIRWGINGVAWGVVVASIFSFAVNLQIITSKMNLSILRYFKAHRSALTYGVFQILVLFGFQYSMGSRIAEDSFLMLISVMLLSVLTFFGIHLVVRFQDINDIFQEFFLDTKKVFSRLPL